MTARDLINAPIGSREHERLMKDMFVLPPGLLSADDEHVMIPDTFLSATTICERELEVRDSPARRLSILEVNHTADLTFLLFGRTFLPSSISRKTSVIGCLGLPG